MRGGTVSSKASLQNIYNMCIYIVHVLRHWVFEGKTKSDEWFIISTHHQEAEGPFSFRRQHQTCYFPVCCAVLCTKLVISQCTVLCCAYAVLCLCL